MSYNNNIPPYGGLFMSAMWISTKMCDVFANFSAPGSAAGLFAKGNDESMVFVVKGGICRQGIHKSLLQDIIMLAAVHA